MNASILRSFFAVLLCLAWSDLSSTVSGADEKDSPAAKVKAEDSNPAAELTVPTGDDVEEFVKFIRKASSTRPKSLEEHIAITKMVKTAADRIMVLETDKSSKVYQNAERDSLAAEVRLLPFSDLKESRATYERAKAIVERGTLGIVEISLANSVARGLEYAHEDLALEAYRAFMKLADKSDEPRVRSSTTMMEGAIRRLTLVGKPLELQGTKLDGTKFDIASLKGKVVLVDFWASWCGPCIAELPNIKQNYERFREQGFEVVGVNIDRQRDAAEKFIDEKKIDWLTLYEEETMGQHPAMRHYGISGIPAMFLIGRDGNVLSIRARGPALTALLEKQFAKTAAAE